MALVAQTVQGERHKDGKADTRASQVVVTQVSRLRLEQFNGWGPGTSTN